MTTGLLLDTHAVVWAASAPERLGRTVRRRLENLSVEVCVSPASAYEVANKVRLGKWPAVRGLALAWPTILQRLGATEVALTGDQMRAAASLPTPHRDPFDRMIAAQAQDLGLAVASVDPAFDDLGCLVVWD